MRALLALIVLLGLSGCTDRERSHLDAFFDANSPFSEDDSPAPSAPIPAQLNPKCREVAYNRSSDVRSQGFDDVVARTVYNSVYADCVAWAERESKLR